jgi:hypothetical protein
MKKTIPYIHLTLLIIMSIILVNIPRAHADGIPTLTVDPSEITVSAPGQFFTVNVTVNNVTLLGAWEFDLFFNNTILNATYVYKTWLTQNNTDWVPYDALGQFDPVKACNNTYNATHGRVDALALFPLTTPVTGSGPLVIINFTAIGIGNCTLNLVNTVLFGNSGPPDYTIWEIAHDSTAVSNVTVMPEFPAVLVVPLLLISTLAAAFLGKMFWSRKRKDVVNAG